MLESGSSLTNLFSLFSHGVWDKGIDSLGPYVKSHTNITEIKEAIALFLRDGVPPEKLVLGLGLYGRAFTLKDPSCTAVGCEFSGPSKAGECTDAEGTLAWFEIADIAAKKDVSPKYDEQSMSEIMVWGDQWVAFDDDKTLSMKREYASSSCFKGKYKKVIVEGHLKLSLFQASCSGASTRAWTGRQGVTS